MSNKWMEKRSMKKDNEITLPTTSEIEELYKNSDLPDKVDKEKINQILIDIRKEDLYG